MWIIARIVEQPWESCIQPQGRESMVDRAFAVYNLNGELRMRIPLMTKENYGAGRMIHHQFPGQPATLRTSGRVVKCDCESRTVELRTGELLSADLIVGSDGIKTKIRRSVLKEVMDPRKGCTTMVIGRNRRVIMGPAINGTYSTVALVPNEGINKDPKKSSWATEGDHNKMMSQGASQSIEDAEAVDAFFDKFEKNHTSGSLESIAQINDTIFRCRREAAKPATAVGDRKVT
ncbi:hypothetical protein BDW59DRAFT_172116 [Aspergillus cavernicola]|uniref:FAD-binding domain-containing protein n=1 Tax=Aspergillus cavernicola TaxID=176166 RepID=A0ABR4IFP5_9EURO